jgi:hypothetical protein
MPRGKTTKPKRRYQWQRLTATGRSVTIKDPPVGARTAALAYAKRHGFDVSCWRTRAGNLVVERVAA